MKRRSVQRAFENIRPDEEAKERMLRNILNSYQNDFDRYENRDSGYIYGPSLPRSVFVGAKLSF